MGRLRKRFNWKARSGGNNTSDKKDNDSSKETIEIDFKVREEKYDSSNPLIILPEQQKLKAKSSQKKSKVEHVQQPLSKKKRKLLAKIIEKKNRKINRVEIIEKLQKVQATSEEIELLTSTCQMQTSGFKKLNQSLSDSSSAAKISNVKGSRKRCMLPLKKKLKLDPNIVGFYDNSSTSDEESDVPNDEPPDITKHIEDSPNTVDTSEQNTETNQNIEVVDSKQMEKKELSNNLSESIVSSDEISKKLPMKSVAIDNPEPAIFIPVNRLPEVQAARESLPIFSEEQVIMEAVRENPVVVIHGETGTGKTTQVPQFLYEGGYTQTGKMIGITEPRRIAAVSMSSRVAKEMNMPDAISYHIRYEKNVDERTKIKFMTDGVLLKEIRQDFLLSRYSVIIVDEAHERSVFSDVLIGLLSRILPLREKKGIPLKLIIMSATLRIEDFTENERLFKVTPFLIRLESRQHKVQIHFNMKTPENYIEASYNKVCKIHRKLPPGAILVFLTGEKEVTKVCKMLRSTFADRKKEPLSNEKSSEDTASLNIFKRNKRKKKNANEPIIALPEKIDLDSYPVEPLDSEILQHNDSDGEGCLSDDASMEGPRFIDTSEPLYVLPLYSILPSEEQEKIFQPPPPGSRLCVVSTNVSETSITIPGLKYVVDSGKVKTKIYDRAAGGISSFEITWASKASANQRAGRAGRTEGGHCYRLYSSAVFENDFPEYSPPEIKRIPVDDVLLQMKALGIDRVVSFPFPIPPDTEALKTAEKRLVLLGALQDLQKSKRYQDIAKWEYSAKVTPLGQAMSRFPLSPRYAKMLLMSYKHNVIQHTIAMVAAMTVPEVFLATAPVSEDVQLNPDDNKQYLGVKKIGAGTGKSLQLGDAMVLLRAAAMYEETKNKINFCIKNGIRHKAMVEIHKMRIQLTREMNRSFENLSLPLNLKLDPPNNEQIDILRKILITGFTDQIAKKVSDDVTRLDKSLKNAYKCLDLEEPVFVHPSSILFSDLPELIVYKEIAQTSKYFMKNITEIEPEWLPGISPILCNFSAPLEKPPPTYDTKQDKILCSMTSTFGRWHWDLPCVRMEMPRGLNKYNLFCFFLLDGQICPLFKEYKKHLLSSPSIMMKTWAKLLPRTRYILEAVISKEIDTKEALYKAWKNDSKFLLREYWEWLPEEKHMEVECKWPPSS